MASTLVSIALLSACGTTRPGAAESSAPGGTNTPAATVAPTTTSTTLAAPVEQAGWTSVYQTATAIVTDTTTETEPDGSHIVVARFHSGATTLDLHAGSEDPATGSVPIPAVAGDAVAPTEAPQLLACFNGGFKTNADAGGFEVAGKVLVPLTDGLASLVVNTAGTPSIGIWGQTVPAAGAQVSAVRQNLKPLVLNGQPTATVGTVTDWGATIGGTEVVARSAVGEDAHGNLLYAGSMSALPSDLAAALVSAGAVTAMELDINPYWVQLDLATSPGGPLTAEIPGQQRPANQCISGWTRDFFTVLGRS